MRRGLSSPRAVIALRSLPRRPKELMPRSIAEPANRWPEVVFKAVRRIDAIFAIEREINGHSASDRLAARQERLTPLVADLEQWMRAERARLSRHAGTAKA